VFFQVALQELWEKTFVTLIANKAQLSLFALEMN